MIPIKPHSLWLFIYACIFTFSSSFSHAIEDNIQIPKLKSNEGYLLAGIEIYNIIPSKIYLQGDSLLSIESIADLAPGDQYRLLALPAGTYTYKRVFNNAHINKNVYWSILERKFSVTVKAGAINYSGHLISDIEGTRYASFSYRNRSSQALRFLDQCCNQLLSKYSFRYTGESPDPYAEFRTRTQGGNK